MGQGEETKTRQEPAVQIQERGEIFFFYRPKVEKEEARGPEDVQRLYMVLRPESGERAVEVKQDPHSGKEGAKNEDTGTSKKKENEDEDGDRRSVKTEGGHGSERVNIEKEPLLRLVVMGRKTLPDPAKKSTPYWGFVEMVSTKVDQVKDALRGEEYDTKTRGHRHLPDARPVAEGIYRILRHDQTTKRGPKKLHTHLIYKLEYPSEDREEQPALEALHISREASFVVQIKNPEGGGGGPSGFRGLQSKRKASFPAHLQGLFGHKKFREADPPDLLNYEGCEFLLISASDDIEEELGLELKTEEGDGDGECSDLIKTFGEVGSSRPLLQGTWV